MNQSQLTITNWTNWLIWVQFSLSLAIEYKRDVTQDRKRLSGVTCDISDNA